MLAASRTRFLLRFVTAVSVALALLAGSPAAAQPSTVEFTVSGTSTVRGWTCSVRGTARVTPGSSAPAPGFAAGVQSAALTVPVADFECPDETMTEHLLEAMKPAEFAAITFRLDSYEATGEGAEASGALTIQGVTKPVSFPLALTPSGAGVEIAGEIALDMTEYGVEPPTVMFGLLRVRPQIRIEFNGLVVP